MIYAFIAFCIFGSALANIRIGACSNVETMKDFNITRYLGPWYENRSFISPKHRGKCIMDNFILQESNNVIVVFSKQSKIFGNPSTIWYNVSVPNASKPAKFNLKPFSDFFNIEISYEILDTDYESYALVYSCTDFKIIHEPFARILTRVRNPSDDIIAKAYKVVEEKLERFRFVKTDQTDCIAIAFE